MQTSNRTRSARLITAIALLVTVVGVFYFGGIVLCIFVAIASGLMGLEVSKLCHFYLLWERLSLGLASALLSVCICYKVLMPIDIALFCLLFSVLIAILRFERGNFSSTQSIADSFFLFLYFGCLVPFLVFFALEESLREQFLWVLSVTIAADSGAWFFGQRFGVKSLAYRTSSGKTKEGALGGFASGMLMGIFLSQMLPNIDYSFELSAFTAILIFAGQLGDLFVSLAKRRANVKDTGLLLPGHGGILDRLDSLLFCTPFALCGSTHWEIYGA